MTLLAPTLQAYFTDRLLRQRQASPHTITAYRRAWRLLVVYAAEQTGKTPSILDIGDLDAALITGFLDHLETVRQNTARSRNARLAAIHSLFAYAAPEHPEHAGDIARVLAIPAKKFDSTLVTHLTEPEITALLAAPDPGTWTGRRDHALVAVTTGLRASELTGLTRGDVHLGVAPHVACHGKGRKDRITPLTGDTVAVLAAWMTERDGVPDDPLFCTRRGTALSLDAIEARVRQHAAKAALTCPSLAAKTTTPHVLRHSTAMRLLHAGIDTSVIALWLGHESIQTTLIYLRADLELKQHALDRTTPPGGRPGHYQPPDHLLAFLDSL